MCIRDAVDVGTILKVSLECEISVDIQRAKYTSPLRHEGAKDRKV